MARKHKKDTETVVEFTPDVEITVDEGKIELELSTNVPDLGTTVEASATPPPEPPAPEPVPVPPKYPFVEITRFEGPGEIRKLEAAPYGFQHGVIIKTSTRFFDSEGRVTACSEALAVIPSVTVKDLQKGRM